MAHTAKNRTLGRKAAPRKALLTNQTNALLIHKRITTTLAKAKALARHIAPIITRARNRAKIDLDHAHRQAFSALCNKKSTSVLFNEILTQIHDRPGGYTRIIKLGTRSGDATNMALIELVDFNNLYQRNKKNKTRRSRRKATKKNDQPQKPPTVEITKQANKETTPTNKK